VARSTSRLNVESTSTGRFSATGDTAFAGRRDGRDTWESSLVAEARTGVDPNPSKADVSIYIDPGSSYLAHLWWDPAIGTSLSANPPNDRTDAFTVLVHELLHGMGIVGWRDIDTGALPGDYQSVWDSLVTVNGNRASFGGAATMACWGSRPRCGWVGRKGPSTWATGRRLATAAWPGSKPPISTVTTTTTVNATRWGGWNWRCCRTSAGPWSPA
jgi:hypothetical protein